MFSRKLPCDQPLRYSLEMGGADRLNLCTRIEPHPCMRALSCEVGGHNSDGRQLLKIFCHCPRPQSEKKLLYSVVKSWCGHKVSMDLSDKYIFCKQENIISSMLYGDATLPHPDVVKKWSPARAIWNPKVWLSILGSIWILGAVSAELRLCLP